jgi:hypothetical protein
MLSSTYALSAADPDNRLLWRANRRRLDAESLRHSLLFVSGKLDLRWAVRQYLSPTSAITAARHTAS